MGNENTVLKLENPNGYSPFGMRLAGLSTDSGNDNKYLYNGKELEDDFKLNWYHYGARYYDPQLGRWLQVDPADEFFSPYVYVGNNPVNFIDPDGQEANLAVRPLDGFLGKFGNHSFVVLLPENPQNFQDYSLIDLMGNDGEMQKGMIVGAYWDKKSDNLIWDINNATDVAAWNSGNLVGNYKLESYGPLNDSVFLNGLLDSAIKYENNREYTAFSTANQVKKGKDKQ